MIAVISDIHDNIPNLTTALTYANSIQASALFVLGDLTNGDTLRYLAENFSLPIYIVQGNCELYDIAELKSYPQIINLGRQGGIIKIADKLLGLCHEPNLASGLIQQGARLIFCGHTHKPWEEIKNGIKLVNPGNLANTHYAPSFAVWEETNDKLELKIL